MNNQHFGQPTQYTPWAAVHLTRDYTQYVSSIYPLFTEDSIGPSRALEIAARSTDLAIINKYIIAKLVANEGPYWTNQTLSYMSKRRATAEKVALCAERYVCDATAGIGGDTLGFALSPRVKHVIACEIDPERRKMLAAVIDLYGLTRRVTIMDKFDGSAPADYCVFIDPPFENSELALLDEPIIDTVERLVRADHTVWLHTPLDFKINGTAWVYPLKKVKLYRFCINILSCRVLNTLLYDKKENAT